MSEQYDLYLTNHKSNVKKGFEWLRDNLPEFIKGDYDFEWQMGFTHDKSKSDPEEYDAYDKYFYGKNKSFGVVQAFNYAWLHHLHNNPHHWQYWVLVADNSDEPEKVLEMPYNYVLEMLMDWWAFSWASNDLTTIFKWYDEHKDYIKLHKNSRVIVESFLLALKDKLSK